MSEIAARHLIAHWSRAIFVANRTHERAVELAKNSTVVPSGSSNSTMWRQRPISSLPLPARLIISFVVNMARCFCTAKEQAHVLHRYRRTRDVDPAVNELDGIFVYDIDDLQSVVTSHVADRQREAARAEEIINVEVQRFLERPGHA